MLWFGLLFVAVVLFKPEGIAGAWRSLVHERSVRISQSAGAKRLRLFFRSG
jgi:branched-chain amino acid transport system permease protein